MRPAAARCVVLAVRRTRGGDGRVERGCGGRLLEAVGMIDSKMTKDARGGRQVVLATSCCVQPHQIDTADLWFECLLLRARRTRGRRARVLSASPCGAAGVRRRRQHGGASAWRLVDFFTTLLLPTSLPACARLVFQPACCAQVCVMKEVRACECEGGVGATGGFRRVSGAFAASSTAQLAAGLSEIHIFSTGVPVLCSPSPSFPSLLPT